MEPDWLSRKIAAKLGPHRPAWLGLGDDELPDWLHGLLCMAIAAPVYLYLGWLGFGAILLRRLEPVEGPEFGQHMFGPLALDGSAAVQAGFSLLLFSASFAAIGFRFTRFEPKTAAGRAAKIWAPWALAALSCVLEWRVGRR